MHKPYQKRYGLCMETYREKLRQIALENDGYVTPALARARGVPDVELRKLAARGAVEKRERGVYRDPYYPAADEFDFLREIILTLGAGVHACGETALQVTGIGELNPKNVYLASPRRHRRKVPRTWRIRSAPADTQVKKYHGIPSQPVAEALVEVRPTVMTDRWEAMVEDAYQEGFIRGKQYRELKGLVG